jgi:hypothetical protein
LLRALYPGRAYTFVDTPCSFSENGFAAGSS